MYLDIPSVRHVCWAGDFIVRGDTIDANGDTQCWSYSDGTFKTRYENTRFAAMPIEPKGEA